MCSSRPPNQLLPQDTGDNIVVWDARIDGGFPVSGRRAGVHDGGSLPHRLTAHAGRVRRPPERNLLRSGELNTVYPRRW